MKKNILLLSLLSFLGLVTSCYDDSELRERIEKLENTTAVVINQQITALQSSVDALKSVDFDLKNEIASLENAGNTRQIEIDSLKKKIAELEATDGDHQAEIEALQGLIAALDSTDISHQNEIDALKEKIAELEATDEDHQAEIEALQGLIAALDSTDISHQTEIDALKEKEKELSQKIEELQKGVDSLKQWVEEILKNYSTTEEINAQFAAVQEQINALNVQVALLLATPDILFDVDGSIAYSPGTTVVVKYTLVNADETTEIECIADAGWKYVVTPAKDGKTGTISITTPSTGGEGKVLVFVSSQHNTVMRVLRFEQGTLTILTNSITVEPQDTILTIDACTNVDFRVVIPTEAQSWIELLSIDTRATMRTDVITLSIKQNVSSQSRSAVITLVDTNEKELSSFTIYQRADVQASNEIWYTSTDGNIVEPSNPRGFGGINIVSNTYVKGKGVIVFDGDVTTVGNGAFQDDVNWSSRLLTISLPKGLTSIGDMTFTSCNSLTSVTIPESVTSIGYYAFYSCTSLASITIPESVTSIGYSAFNGCSSLTSVAIPNSMTAINQTVFELCTNLTSITIPESVTSIGNGAFGRCWSLTSINIPESVISIGYHAFMDCTSLTSITIPESITNIGERAFDGCKGLTSVVCLEATPLDISSDVFSNDVTDYCTLYVPVGSVNAYSVAEGWKDFKIIKEIDNQ